MCCNFFIRQHLILLQLEILSHKVNIVFGQLLVIAPLMRLKDISNPQMFQEVIDISECVYRENYQSEYPEHAEGYELISSTHSVSFTVDIHHYQLMPPEFHVA